MLAVDTLGVLAHSGGVLVARPELSVVLVQAIARSTGLEMELLARRPLDRRSALERQSDIRAARGAAAAAPRRLLPPADEGLDLRVGWLDAGGRPHWTFDGWNSDSGDSSAGTWGPSLRGVVELPPMFDGMRLVLAWPEIGFPETVIRLPLPDRASVERGTVPVWQAPVDSTPAPGPFRHHIAAHVANLAHAEVTGRAGTQRVLARHTDAVVVLNRLTYLESALSLEVVSDARGAAGRHACEVGFPPGYRSPWPQTGELIRAEGPGARLAVLRGADAYWVSPSEATAGGGLDRYTEVCEIAVPRPADGVLDLLVAWPLVGLPDVRARIALESEY